MLAVLLSEKCQNTFTFNGDFFFFWIKYTEQACYEQAITMNNNRNSNYQGLITLGI